jgi:hypothetical protein
VIYTEAEQMFREIKEAVAADDALLALYRSFLLSAIRYARYRTDWRINDIETRKSMDAPRRAAHNNLISDCDILSRNLAAQGRPNDWRGRLGGDRKVIGDFACYVHSILGVEAR